MSIQTFTVKQLRYTFTLSNGATFAGSNNNTLVLTGLRSRAAIQGSGMPAFPYAEMKIYGVFQSDMNALIALAFQTEGLQRNSILVEANSGSGWSSVFAGQIITAQPDYAAFPEVSLAVTARVLQYESIAPTAPTSFPGVTDVATVISAIALKMGSAFLNNGVTGTLASPYFDGVGTDQLREACKAANIACYQEGVNQSNSLVTTIVISPLGTARADLPIFQLSEANGLVGYPSRDSRGYISVQAAFNPAFRQGAQIDLSNINTPNIPNSDYLNANGNWLIGTVHHDLSEQLPGGPWFSEMLCYPIGQPPPTA